MLVGPSGCGKSTSLRMLAGLESVESGRIEIGGHDVTDLPPRARDVAMVFQSYALYPNMTVAQNMGFALRNARMSKADTVSRVREAARILELEPLLGRKPAKLSGGQRQRVAMGRAIVRQPKVFCMDEPLSNLDAQLRVSTRSQIAGLQRRLGTTTVYVTHDQVEAMTMGDRVAVLRDGRLQQIAAPRKLYDDPVNTFVAGFLGAPGMNLLTAPNRPAAASNRRRLRAATRPRPAHPAAHHQPGPRRHRHPTRTPDGLRGQRHRRGHRPGRRPRQRNLPLHPRPPRHGRAVASRATRSQLADTVELRHADGAVHLFHPDTGDRIG